MTDDIYSWVFFLGRNSDSFEQKGVLKVSKLSYSKLSYDDYILYAAMEGEKSNGYISKINPQKFYSPILPFDINEEKV